MKTIKVVIIEERPYYYKIKDKYTGMLYKMWESIKDNLTGYNFEETIIKTKDYNKIVEEVEGGIYDIAVGNFSVFTSRLELVDFTRPLYINKVSVVYIPKLSNFQILYKLVKDNFLYPLLLILLLGFILGVLLYSVESFRGFKRSILTSISSLLGETGFLAENSRLSIISIIVVIIMMLISFFFVIYITALTTTDLITIKNKDVISKENIDGKVILAPQGYETVKYLEKFGAEIKFIDGDFDEILQYYIKNKELYSGVVMDLLEAEVYASYDKNLKINSEDFSYDEIAFPVSKKLDSLENDINISIAIEQDRFNLEEICNSYYGVDDSHLCSI